MVLTAHWYTTYRVGMNGNSISEIIEHFGGPAAFARQVGMTVGAAKQAKRRNSLHPRYFMPVVRAAQSRGFALSEKTLVEIAEHW